jgi:hypothetical protein
VTALVEVALDDMLDASEDLALAELESARRATRMAEQSAEEAETLAREGVGIAEEWARAARLFASIASVHAARSDAASRPLSATGRAAKDAADRAANYATAAESACRRD